MRALKIDSCKFFQYNFEYLASSTPVRNFQISSKFVENNVRTLSPNLPILIPYI